MIDQVSPSRLSGHRLCLLTCLHLLAILRLPPYVLVFWKWEHKEREDYNWPSILQGTLTTMSWHWFSTREEDTGGGRWGCDGEERLNCCRNTLKSDRWFPLLLNSWSYNRVEKDVDRMKDVANGTGNQCQRFWFRTITEHFVRLSWRLEGWQTPDTQDKLPGPYCRQSQRVLERHARRSWEKKGSVQVYSHIFRHNWR